MFESARRRLGDLPARWPWLRVLVDVHKRFGEVNGSFLAGALSMSIFLSIFPLLLVGLAVIGFLGADEGFAREIVSGFGLTGDAADVVTDAVGNARENRSSSTIIGLAGLLWTGLGVVSTLETSVNTVWQVKGRGITGKVLALAWLAAAALLLVGSFTLTGLLNVLPGVATPAAFVASAAVHVAVALWTFNFLGNTDVGWRAHLPGAIAGGIGFQVLTTVGAVYVPRAVASSSALYGSIGTVFALLAWLLFFGRLIVYSAALNVVLYERDRGTLTTEIQVPNLPDVVPLEASRSGIVAESRPSA